MEITTYFDYNQLPSEIKKSLSDANVFFTKDWYQYTMARNERICYIYSEVYILPIRIKKVLFLKGGILDSEPYRYNDANQSEKDFLNACCSFLKKQGIVDWVQSEISSCFLSYPDNATVFGGGNYILDLRGCTEEELFMKVHSKNRNMIRRGEKEGITISRTGAQIVEDYKALEDQVWERSNRPPRSLEYYHTLLNHMPNTTKIAVAYNKEGTPEAGAIFLYTSAMGYYHHGASKNHPTPGAHNYLIWEQILLLKRLGVKKINFVGYRRPTEVNPNVKSFGIQNFKAKFGGEVLETYGFRYNCNQLHFLLYRTAAFIFYKEPFRDVYSLRSRHYPEWNHHKGKK